jgi:hypothetical protein
MEMKSLSRPGIHPETIYDNLSHVYLGDHLQRLVAIRNSKLHSSAKVIFLSSLKYKIIAKNDDDDDVVHIKDDEYDFNFTSF